MAPEPRQQYFLRMMNRLGQGQPTELLVDPARR